MYRERTDTPIQLGGSLAGNESMAASSTESGRGASSVGAVAPEELALAACARPRRERARRRGRSGPVGDDGARAFTYGIVHPYHRDILGRTPRQKSPFPSMENLRSAMVM